MGRPASRPLFLMAAIMRAASSVVSGWTPPARVHSFDDIEHAIAQFDELSERPFLIRLRGSITRHELVHTRAS